MHKWHNPYSRKGRGIKEPLDEGEKAGLKLSIHENEDHGFWSYHFMVNRCRTMEIVTYFIFLGSNITVDRDCSHEIKRRLLLGRKAMTNLDSILKSRDITLPSKVHLAKAMVFPVVMYRCESWTIKKAECQRIAAFELWFWRRLLRLPCTVRRSNESVLKEITMNIHRKDWCWSSNTLATWCQELTH